MERETNRSQVIARASWVGIFGNGVLALLNVGFGIWGHSLALIGAGIDTVTDVAASIVTLLAGRIVDKPPDEKHPYGHGRAETIATKLLGFIIFFAGTQLVLSTVSHLFSDSVRRLPAFITIVIAGISIVGKLFLALLKWRAGKKAHSSMLIADAKNMTMDIFISASVLIGIYFTIRMNMPMVDTLLGLGVGLYIMKVGYGIFMETNMELMDGLQDRDPYRQVCRAVLAVEGVRNPHRMRIRKLNTSYVIDIDIEVDGGITVQEGHNLAMQVEESIHTRVKNVYDVNVHVEPVGNLETEERFGLSQECLQKKDKISEG
ncbi:MAG: cation diffusion facilitator family transporter [Spirochaetota bacterium]|nr:cation diffusion facilitator family transporter [Spirochaetota bacterium]